MKSKMLRPNGDNNQLIPACAASVSSCGATPENVESSSNHEAGCLLPRQDMTTYAIGPGGIAFLDP